MDVPTLMHNLREEVTCSVCMQLFTKPKQLPCLHIFCLQCLNNLAQASPHNGMIKCPLCQREVAVPETGTLETLPSSFHMKNLLDILAIKECNTSKVTCGNCEKKSEEPSYCFHCGKFWCNDCLNGHNILRENREHRVLELKDFEDQDFEDVLKRPVFCQKELHDKEVLKFYCKECESPVCQTCVIVQHNKHDVEHLEVAAREVKRSLASKLNVAKESLKTIVNCIRELDEKSRLLEHGTKINKEQIQEIVNSLIVTLRQKKQESIAEVENQRMEAQEQISRTKDDLQDQFKRRDQSISQIEALLQRSTGVELVRSTEAMLNEPFQVLQLQQPHNMPLSERKIPTTVFLRNRELSKILKESRVGHLNQSQTEAKKCSVQGLKAATAGLEIELEVITRDSEGKQYYCPTDYITVQLFSTQDLSINCIADKVKITDKKNGCYEISFIPNEAGKHLLTVQVNGENLREFPPVDVKERSFTPVRTIGEGTATEDIKLEYPWGVTVNNSNEIVVSDKDNDRIVVFSEKGELLKSFGQGILNCPNGLCIDNTGRIIVGNRNDNKVFLVQENGECVLEIHNGSSLKKPRGISLDAQGNLAVCDAGNRCVKFFSLDGSILKSIGRGRLEMPVGCLCYEDKIFVSDHEDHSIKVFHIDGRFLYEFGSYGKRELDLNRPGGLALDKTGHLLVCSFDNHKVQVFTLDGNFVTQFGEQGKEMGQMYCPTDVSVLKSGHIVVCDHGNCRLQIFE